MSPRTLLEIARRRALIVAVCAIVVPASALGWSIRQDKEYTATAQLLFRDPGFDQKLFGTPILQPSQSPERQAATNVLLVTNRRVAERTARARPFGLTAAQIGAKRMVSAEGQADVISIAMTDTSATRAAELANTYAREFINVRRDADRAKIAQTQNLIADQLAQRSSDRSRTPADEESLRRQEEQLKVLASLQTGNAELLQTARPPGSPSAPRTNRNVVLGGLLGLLLGLGLAVLAERFDRRLRDNEEIEDALGHPTLGTVPESRELAQWVPVTSGTPAHLESESFNMIRANLRYFNVDKPIKSILITSAVPGEGKSTIAWNLAAAAAAAGDLVLLIEADLRHPSRLTGNDVDPNRGLGALLAGNADLTRVLKRIPVSTARASDGSPRHLDVVHAGAVPPNPTDLLESEAMSRLITIGEERYDLVVIDASPTVVISDAIPLAKQVSGVLVVARLGMSIRPAVQQLRRQLENLNVPVLGVVVNSMTSSVARYGYGYGSQQAASAAANGRASDGSGDPEAGSVDRHSSKH